MKRLCTLLLLMPIGLASGCVRELGRTRCPCVTGWVCCEEQNICLPEGKSCGEKPAEDEGASSETQGDSRTSDEDAATNDEANSGPHDVGVPEPDASATVMNAEVTDAEVTDAEVTRDACVRGPDTLSCPGGPFSFSLLESQDAVKQAVIGRWQLCAGEAPNWGPANARGGLEFTSDGEFFLLGLDEEGVLQRVVGVETHGKYAFNEGYYPSGGPDPNVYVTFSEGTFSSFSPSFDASRDHMVALSYQTSILVRVPADEGSVSGVVTPGACGAAQDAGADATASCDGSDAPTCPGGPFNFARILNASETQQALLGRWQVCEGSVPATDPGDARDGMEFTADGHFYLLDLDAQGALQRAVGLYTRGTYELGSDDNPYVSILNSEGTSFSLSVSFDNGREHAYASYYTGASFVRVPEDANSVPGVVPARSCN